MEDGGTQMDSGVKEKVSVAVDMSGVDWELLRKQKQHLLSAIDYFQGSEPDINEGLEGILNLLDHVQDEAEKVIGKEIVFGKGS
jgi:hypothetical protein